MNRNVLRTSVGLLAVLCLSTVASAQSKIGVANPAKIFGIIQETNDLKVKLENDRRVLEQQNQEKQAKINEAKAARDLLKPDAPQYNDKNQELLKLSIDYRAWIEGQKANLEREQKVQMVNIFVKIEQAVAIVAAKKGLDLVLVDQKPDVDVENMTVDQLRASLNVRSVLFASPTSDISAEVVAEMDAKYKSGK